MNLEEGTHADDVGMTGRGRQVPEKFRFLDELLQSEGVDLLDVRTDRDDRVFGIAFADCAWEILFNRNKFAEINSATLVDDAKTPDAENVFQTPFADDRPRGQRLVAVRLAHCRFPFGRFLN